MRYIYQGDLDKDCFQHDMAYGYFKDLSGRIVSDKILHGKAFNVAKNLDMMNIKEVFFQLFLRDLTVVVLKMKIGQTEN